jgi:hypothetical protein
VQERHLPLSARHGTVLPITVAEYQALLSALPARSARAHRGCHRRHPVRRNSALRSTVSAVLGPGSVTEHDLGAVPVSWEPVDPCWSPPPACLC